MWEMKFLLAKLVEAKFRSAQAFQGSDARGPE